MAFWATLYGVLSTDTDHRIREAVHNAHYQVIIKDKKSIAPYLKQLIGPWFTSQYDNYPPAASAAVKAFNTAFPPNKVQDCLTYCQKEILNYIHDNLTAKLESNVKTVASAQTNEDLEAKYERVIISSLQGYCLYLTTLTDEQIKNCVDLNQVIIKEANFFKLANHKSALIRGSWFKVLATLYHKAAFLLVDLHVKMVPVVFNHLDENEPAVVGFVWEAALLIMDQCPVFILIFLFIRFIVYFSLKEWWKHINIEKMYLGKLKKVLRDGGQGNAIVIYPNLLSILHKLPPGVASEQFYDSFFECIRLG